MLLRFLPEYHSASTRENARLFGFQLTLGKMFSILRLLFTFSTIEGL